MSEEISCGSAQCLVEKMEESIKETMKDQHKETKEFFREVIALSVQPLAKEITEIKGIVKENGDELFRRMRDVEGDIKLIKAETGIGHDKGFVGTVRDILVIKSEDALAEKIAKEIKKDPDVSSLRTTRKFLWAIIVPVFVTLILVFGKFIFTIFDLHDLLGAKQVESGKK